MRVSGWIWVGSSFQVSGSGVMITAAGTSYEQLRADP